MASSRVNCEIVEAKEESSTIRKPQTFQQVRGEQRPPILKKGYNKCFEDDINKLFESVNLRTSKSLDLSDSWRNASKRPMRSVGSHSPVIGFSEPVTLKQALRGLCISQAAEMAATKRVSTTSASPRVSEAGKKTSLYRSGWSPAQRGGRRMEVSPMMEASTSYSSRTLSRANQDSFKKSTAQSSCPSPSDNVKANIKSIERISSEPSSPQNPVALKIDNTEPSSVCNDSTYVLEDDKQLMEIGCSQGEKCNFESALPQCNSCDIVPKSDSKPSHVDKVISGPVKNSALPLKVVNKDGPKVRRKSKLHSAPSLSGVKSKEDVKSTRSTSRTVKPVIRNKNLIIKKFKKVASSTDGNSETSLEEKSGTEQFICQRCKCSLKDTKSNSNGAPPTNDLEEIGAAHVITANMTTESSEKGDISLSSSSICDFSSSTTSLSEESNLSGSTSGNRPHMSKDTRWGAITRVRKQYGFLGLNHFNLLKKVGSGDIGTVYLAELIGMNCMYAIKVMDNEFLVMRKKMPRAQTEREILRTLDHPFLPTLYAQFTSDNLSCLVMEFCPGGDLHVLRQRQPGRYFPEQAARFYVAEVLLALEYLHMLGIVYRDLKPENILVREDGHIMLTDFDLSLRCSFNPTLVKSSSSLPIEPPRISGPCAGSSCIDPFCASPSCKVSCLSPRLFSARKLKPSPAAHARSLPQLVCEPTEARSNSFVGTHEYLAPEIIKGEGHGSAVDWWTFGILLYELLYGKTPFKGSGNEETLANVVLQSLKFPDSPMVSFQARDLIRGLLVKDPENRLGTETGAAEIKRHPFFDGLNWALIRCAIPPEIPEFYDVGNSEMGDQEKGKGFVDYSGCDGDRLEFELF